MITFQPTPDPLEHLAEQIAETVFGTAWDVEARAQLKRQLLEFAAVIQRQVHA